MSDMIGILEEIHEDDGGGRDDDSDTDTLTFVDDDKTSVSSIVGCCLLAQLVLVF